MVPSWLEGDGAERGIQKTMPERISVVMGPLWTLWLEVFLWIWFGLLKRGCFELTGDMHMSLEDESLNVKERKEKQLD